MAPLILVTTALSHLCGGSAGREGIALQTGASLADQFTRPFVGGALVAIAALATYSTRYLGVGVPVMLSAFAFRLPIWD